MIRFLTSIVVEGRHYADGATVAETEIPAGSLACLLRMRQAEVVPVAATPAPPPIEVDPPKPAAKKAAKTAASDPSS